MYASPHLAEFYDIYWSDFFASANDTGVYQDQLTHVRSTSTAATLTVLDVATGTGRILLHLAKTQPAVARESYIGIDLAADMIDRAKSLTPPSGPQPTWLVGSALEMESLVNQAVPSSTIDLLVLAFGSVSHFGEPAQLRSFLGQVKKLLRPSTGRAAISIATSLLDVKEDGPIGIPGETDTKFMPSKSFPGILYKEVLFNSQIVNGKLFDRREVIIVRETSTGETQEVSREMAVTEFSIFKTEELLQTLAHVGLKLVQVKKLEVEHIWILEHNEE